jgi:hypothetical protein
MIEGSESVPLTNRSGSGSRRPKSIRILLIRIRNTGFRWYEYLHDTLKMQVFLTLTSKKPNLKEVRPYITMNRQKIKYGR